MRGALATVFGAWVVWSMAATVRDAYHSAGVVGALLTLAASCAAIWLLERGARYVRSRFD